YFKASANSIVLPARLENRAGPSLYANKLFGDFKLKIVRPGEEIHPLPHYQTKNNGRSRKHPGEFGGVNRRFRAGK
ncbi:1351_t:CDS:2, partial [Dentiscutata erythropus]